MTRFVISLFCACLTTTICAQQITGSVSDAEYHSRYGRAEMNISCSPRAHSPFERGLLQMHSFAWDSARASFDEAVKADPDCAMAWWGVAMTYYDGLHEHPSDEEVEAARAALARAWQAGSRTEREAGYLTAAGEIFAGYPDVTRAVRDQNYSEAMAELHRSHPDDHEAAAFYALSLLSLARRRASDHTLQMQAAAILEPLLQSLPDHPGVAHYLIHAYDDAGMREPGIEAARRYADIAPVLTHPQHMPAHIFGGLGMWEENNRSNATALEADPTYYHALMYLVYGELQIGQRKQAAARVHALQKQAYAPAANRAAKRGLHSVNTWLILETRNWQAATEAPAHSDAAVDMLDTFYIRGLGGAHSGNLVAADAALVSLKDLLAKLELKQDNDNLVRIRLAQLQVKQIEAQILHAGGHNEEALAAMQQAVIIANGPGINRAAPDSGTGLPAHETYGELLHAVGRHDEAMQQFETALQRTPNRLYSLLGLARAAAASGDHAIATARYQSVLQQLANADPDIEELAEARRYLEANR